MKTIMEINQVNIMEINNNFNAARDFYNYSEHVRQNLVPHTVGCSANIEDKADVVAFIYNVYGKLAEINPADWQLLYDTWGNIMVFVGKTSHTHVPVKPIY